MKNILDISELEELQKYLLSFSDKESMREQLFSDFLKYARYRNAEEWNNAVRITTSRLRQSEEYISMAIQIHIL